MIYVLVLLTGAVTALQIENFKSKEFKLRVKAWLTLLVVMGATIIAIVVQTSAESDAKAEKIKSDLAADARVRNSTKTILYGFGNAIGKFGLKYDSTKQELVALIKDSLNRPTIFQGESPNINFDLESGIVVNSFSNDSIKLTVTVRSYAALAILKTASVYWIYAYNKEDRFYSELKYDTSMTFLSKNMGMPKDASASQIMTVKRNNLKRPPEVIIFIKGSYTDSHGKNPQPLGILASYYLDSKEFSFIPQPYDDSVRMFLRKKGIIK